MSAVSIRFPEDIERALSIEAKRLRKHRSELVRDAVRDYLERQTKQRVMDDMVAEMQEWLDDPNARDDSTRLAEDLSNHDLNALAVDERRPGEDSDRRWWR